MRLIFGAGGHGRVLLDTLRALGEFPDAFLDDGKVGQEIDGLEVLPRSILDEHPDAVVYHGIWYCDVRRRIGLELARRSVRTPTVIHPAAWVSPGAEIGEGTVVYAGAMVNVGAVVGRGAILNTGCVIEHDAVVGDWAHVSPNASLGGAAELGVGSWAGMGSSVIELVKVGANTVLGAGAVATRDVPDGVVAVGVPARVVRRR